METLFYAPLSLDQIFRSKVLASFLLSMAVSLLSFLGMFIVVEAEIFFLMGTFLVPDQNWLVILALLSPSVSLIAVTLIVKGSAKPRAWRNPNKALFSDPAPSPADRGTGFRPYAPQSLDPADFKSDMYRDCLYPAEKSRKRLCL